MDLGHLLRAQGEPWNYDRIFGVDGDVLSECDDDVLLAGALLLGRDVRELFAPTVNEQLVPILADQTTVDCPLVREMEGTVRLSLELVTAFRAGLAGVRLV